MNSLVTFFFQSPDSTSFFMLIWQYPKALFPMKLYNQISVLKFLKQVFACPYIITRTISFHSETSTAAFSKGLQLRYKWLQRNSVSKTVSKTIGDWRSSPGAMHKQLRCPWLDKVGTAWKHDHTNQKVHSEINVSINGAPTITKKAANQQLSFSRKWQSSVIPE